ncbi:metal ABC transporter solute-binding protein, Zn/Mn family [Roseobacter weihaiensis]|uniref:metal ABC transporter solute-binding protein, Zn/Mn family n=1 Tax=Roseobacter weihaiensis TaxID=2763262 RepID=UPI00387389C3
MKVEIVAQLAPLPGHPFIVFHDSHHYFEARFGLEAVAAVTFEDTGTVSAARLARVRDMVTDTGGGLRTG